MIRWHPLAREECKALVTSKGVWLLAAVLVVWTYRPKYVTWSELGPDMVAGFVQFSSFALTLAVILLAYRTIAGDRSDGRLKFVLALPLTRGEILLGKLAGRIAGITVPTFVAFGVVTLVGVVRYGLFSPLRYLGMLAITFAYIAVLASIVVAVSAIVERSLTAVAALFVGLFVPTMLWRRLSMQLYTTLTGTNVDPLAPPAEGELFLLARLIPLGAYHTVSNWILGAGNSAELHDAVLSDLQPGPSNALVVDTTFDTGAVPFYLHESGGFLILAVWGVVPLTVAYHRFNRGDLV